MADPLSPTASSSGSSSTQQRPSTLFLRQDQSPDEISPQPPKKRSKGPSCQEIQELQVAVLRREEQVLIRKEAVLEKLERLLDKCLANNQLPVFVSTLDVV